MVRHTGSAAALFCWCVLPQVTPLYKILVYLCCYSGSNCNRQVTGIVTLYRNWAQNSVQRICWGVQAGLWVVLNPWVISHSPVPAQVCLNLSQPRPQLCWPGLGHSLFKQSQPIRFYSLSLFGLSRHSLQESLLWQNEYILFSFLIILNKQEGDPNTLQQPLEGTA